MVSSTKKRSRSGLIFDTLAMARRLRDAGVPEQQANEQVEIIAEVFEQNMSTKHDMELLRKDLEVMKLDTIKEIYRMKSSIITWVVGLLLAQAGFIEVIRRLF